MTLIRIPCDLPSAGTVEDFFIPMQSPYDAAILAAHTSATTGALTVGSTAGYLIADEAGYEAAEYAAGGTSTGYSIGFRGDAEPTSLTIPRANVLDVRAVAVARAASGSHDGVVIGIRTGGANWTGGTTPVTLSADWATLSTSQQFLLGSDAAWSAFTARLGAGTLGVQMEPSRVPGEAMGVVHLAWLAIEIEYTSAGAPPLRQFPRNDGLAGSARRLWPPPRSVQRSNRRAGGYL